MRKKKMKMKKEMNTYKVSGSVCICVFVPVGCCAAVAASNWLHRFLVAGISGHYKQSSENLAPLIYRMFYFVNIYFYLQRFRFQYDTVKPYLKKYKSFFNLFNI